jgi:hypothetical protein
MATAENISRLAMIYSYSMTLDLLPLDSLFYNNQGTLVLFYCVSRAAKGRIHIGMGLATAHKIRQG